MILISDIQLIKKARCPANLIFYLSWIEYNSLDIHYPASILSTGLLDLWPEIRYPIAYLTRCPVSCQKSGIRPNSKAWYSANLISGFSLVMKLIEGWTHRGCFMFRPKIWPDIRYPSEYLVRYLVSCRISGLSLVMTLLEGWSPYECFMFSGYKSENVGIIGPAYR